MTDYKIIYLFSSMFIGYLLGISNRAFSFNWEYIGCIPIQFLLRLQHFENTVKSPNTR